MKRLLTVLIVSMLVDPAHAAIELERFGRRRSLSLPAVAVGETFVRVPIPLELYGTAAPGLADLRVFGGEEEVRYHVRARRRETSRSELLPRLLNSARAASGDLSFELQLPEHPLPSRPHNRVELSLRGDEFLFRARVEGMTAGRRFLALGDSAWVYRLGGDRSSQRVEVRYPDATFSLLRVTLEPALLTKEGGRSVSSPVPPEIEAARMFFEQETPGRETRVETVLREGAKFVESRDTELVMDLGRDGIPIHRIEWTVAGKNFQRHVDVAGSHDEAAWAPVTGAALFRFSLAGKVEEKTHVDLEGTYRFYRARIANGDNPPLTVETCRAFHYVRELVFAAHPGRSYVLYYGDRGAARPSYDIAGVVDRLNLDSLPEGALGSEESNPAFRPPAKPWTDRYPWLLWVALALTVVILGVLVVRSMMRVAPGG